MTKTELWIGIGSIVSAIMNIYLYWKFGDKQTKDNERAELMQDCLTLASAVAL